MKPIMEIVDNLKYPESLYRIFRLRPGWIMDTFDLMPRLKCQNCGLWKRAILCPPYLWKTYPQFKSFKSTKNFIRTSSIIVVFIWKNDGTKSWKIDKRDLSHIEFKKKIGMQLKGTEIAQSKMITKLMKGYERKIKKEGYKVFSLIAGHCDLCGKCPNRDNPPCKIKGMPSLEAIGIDVFKLLDKLKIKYQHPVNTELTQATMMMINKGG